MIGEAYLPSGNTSLCLPNEGFFLLPASFYPTASPVAEQQNIVPHYCEIKNIPQQAMTKDLKVGDSRFRPLRPAAIVRSDGVSSEGATAPSRPISMPKKRQNVSVACVACRKRKTKVGDSATWRDASIHCTGD